VEPESSIAGTEHDATLARRGRGLVDRQWSTGVMTCSLHFTRAWIWVCEVIRSRGLCESAVS
jgi:hypothetical protein